MPYDFEDEGIQMSQIIASTYELIEKKGSGGGGTVFLANHLRLGKQVVLKVAKGKIMARPDMLRREVDILKDLNHPYIPQVYDFFSEGSKVYTVMEYIEGESLDKPLKRGETYSQPQVIRWARQLLEALCYLHSPTHGSPPHGYVHSDIKPANLMRTSNHDIYLIDFNIALALGEEDVIGCSAGYASPEHYGLDYSSYSSSDETETSGEMTATLEEESVTMLLTETISLDSANKSYRSFRKKKVVPDIRSDIYSVGATLYHLLSGHRPSKDAREVIPLSEEAFSPQIRKIISKAMDPNPDLRYQTAEEMLDAFTHLRENDPRVKRQKRNRRVVCTMFLFCFTAGIMSSFIGLKKMQVTEKCLKLAEYSRNALAKGNSALAVNYALRALPIQHHIFEPDSTASAQKALTNALGVYDLSDGYKIYETLELPSAPFQIVIAPDGKTAACVYAYSLTIIDTVTCNILTTIPMERSALSEVKYLDNSTVVYAGQEGIQAYDIKNNKKIWTGKPATAISVSGDGKSVAAIYKKESFVVIYDADNGKVKHTIDFEGKYQQVTGNDNFANPNDNLLAMNRDGTLLSVSFADGSLKIYDLMNSGKNMEIFGEKSGYAHFEGGFYQQYFAFSASTSSNSVFAVVDTNSNKQTGGFESEMSYSVQTDEHGIYVQTENILVDIHPVTGEQTPLITTPESVSCFATNGTHTLAAGKKGVLFFDKDANLMSSQERKDSSDFVQIAQETALIGSRDSPIVQIMKYEDHLDTEVLSYDSSYIHDEARISGDGNTVMLFSYKQFRLYNREGKQITQVFIPDAEEIYDQQYIRDEQGSRLEVVYKDGTVSAYDAQNGKLLYKKKEEAPDSTLYEEFETNLLRIESPLHGAPKVFDKKTGKLLCRLEEDAYLTYVTQIEEGIITQYVTADGYCYGLMLNEKCEVMANLPYLCDVAEETLFFDYPSGDMRESSIYDLKELIEMGQNQTRGENETL